MIRLSLFSALPFAQTGISDPNLFNEFLILAYFVMGAIGLIYVASLVIRQRNLEKDIQLMKHLLEDEEETAAS
ncbi:MAG: hypothetical protein AAF490_05660 [Chloroflexota bacterium]